MSEKSERPALGEWCDVLSECYGRTHNDVRTWKAWIDDPVKVMRPKFNIRGMYVGFRIVFEGVVKRTGGYDSDTGQEYGWLTEIKPIEVWLFVLKANHDPIRAFPRHVRRDEIRSILKEIQGVE